MKNIDFESKKVLVLGGDGDIGSEVVSQFERSGAEVFSHSRSQQPYAADVRDSGQLSQLMDTVLSQSDGIDILVNALSAPLKIGPIGSKIWSDFEAQMNVQLKAAVEVLPQLLPSMKEKRYGRIINVLTTYAENETPSYVADYVAAKYALLGLTRCMAKELGRFGITVNAVSPGLVSNDFSSVFPEKLTEVVVHGTPLGRTTRPIDVANAVLFLASDEAEFITGENMHVTGGSHL